MTILDHIAILAILAALVAAHELGHYLAARAARIPVTVVSIGLGKALISWSTSSGTEFRLCAVPLGGYVRLRTSDDLPQGDASLAFDRSRPLNRAMVYAAGPAASILCGALLLWLAFMVGQPVIAPVVEQILPQSAAQAARFMPGDRVVEVAGRTVAGWDAAIQAIEEHRRSGSVSVLIEDAQGLRLHRTLDGIANPPVVTGLVPHLPIRKSVITEVAVDGPADLPGPRVGDDVIAFDDVPFALAMVRPESEQSVPSTLTVRRGTEILTLPAPLNERGAPAFSVRVEIAKDALESNAMRPWAAIEAALRETHRISWGAAEGILRVPTGRVATQEVLGPIQTAVAIEKQVARGLYQALYVAAVLSILLGVYNLVPMLPLDGGHLAVIAVEGLTGRKISVNWLVVSTLIGFGVISGVLIIGIVSDVMRYWT